MLSRAASLRQLGISRTQLLPESFEPVFVAALANQRSVDARLALPLPAPHAKARHPSPSRRLSELSVDASDNELGERCARGLAEQLRRLGSAATGRTCGLCGLKMRSTSLTADGVCALLEPLAAQTNLVQLDLSANLRKKMVPWPSDTPLVRRARSSAAPRLAFFCHANLRARGTADRGSQRAGGPWARDRRAHLILRATALALTRRSRQGRGRRLLRPQRLVRCARTP